MRRPAASLLLAFAFAIAAAAPAAAEPLVVRAPRLIDGRGHLLRGAAVVVDGGKIVAVDEHPSHVDVELAGATLMPGGVDTHVHIAWHFDADPVTGQPGRSHDDEGDRGETPAQAALFAAENAYRTLMGGVTTVQSLGAPMDEALREATARGVLPGPRVLTSLEPIADELLSIEQLRAGVVRRAEEGADVIKVFASQSIRTGGGPTMSQAQLDAICGEAKRRGLRVAVHAHGPESVARAVRAGCTSIEHGALIDQPTLDLMAAHGTWFDPNTDLVFRNYFENKPHFLGIGNYTEEGFASMARAVPRVLEVFKKGLRTPGLKIVFGTDALAGSHGRNFQELEYRVRVGGQEPMAAITSATSLAAESLGLGDRIGTLAPGYEADVIAVAGDPLQDIGALERVVFVMRGGKVYKSPFAVAPPATAQTATEEIAAARIELAAAEEAPPIRLVSPSADRPLVAGGTAELAWEPLRPFEAGERIEEWEAFLSLDGGATYPLRLTPHLDQDVRRFSWRVPAVPSGDVRLLLRFGDERRETAVAIPQRFTIVAATVSPPLGDESFELAHLSSRLAGESALPGQRGVASWVEGSRRGDHLRQRVGLAGAAVAPAQAVRGASHGDALEGGEEAPVEATAARTPAAEEPPRPRLACPPALAPPRPCADLRLLTQRQNE